MSLSTSREALAVQQYPTIGSGGGTGGSSLAEATSTELLSCIEHPDPHITHLLAELSRLKTRLADLEAKEIDLPSRWQWVQSGWTSIFQNRHNCIGRAKDDIRGIQFIFLDAGLGHLLGDDFDLSDKEAMPKLTANASEAASKGICNAGAPPRQYICDNEKPGGWEHVHTVTILKFSGVRTWSMKAKEQQRAEEAALGTFDDEEVDSLAAKRARLNADVNNLNGESPNEDTPAGARLMSALEVAVLAQEVAHLQEREAYLSQKVRTFCAKCEKQTFMWCGQSDKLKAQAEALEKEAQRLRRLGIEHGLGAFLLPVDAQEPPPEDYYSDNSNGPDRMAAWRAAKRKAASEFPESPTSAVDVAPSTGSDDCAYSSVTSN